MQISKSEIRKEVARRRNEMSKTEKELYDDIIFNKLISHEKFIKANSIFIYVSYKNEVDTHKIITYAKLQGKTIYVPKVLSLKDGMIACKIDSIDDLKPNKMGILEPKDVSEYNEKQFDLVIMPGVAFDKFKNRIGYGGGMYDKFLERSNLYKIAVAYSYQVFESLNIEEHDIKIDELITN